MEYSLPFKPKVDSYFLGIEAFESKNYVCLHTTNPEI